MGINLMTPSTEISCINKENIQELREFNIQIQKQELIEKLENSIEVDKIVSTLAVYEPETIVSFGNQVAEEIGRCSDSVLNSMKLDQINDSSEMLTLLGKIMDKFDIDEIKDKQSNFLQRIFGGAKKQIEKILDKYHTMGEEIDKIYIKLKQYEEEIKQSNKKLDMIFQTNIDYYQELMKYILAGEQGIRELDDYIMQKEEEMHKGEDKTIEFDLNILYQSKEILEQRVHDLKIAENVALQSIPMLKTMQYSNVGLIRKINSAFIITLPIFKQALSQAILLKRQKIQAEAMSALDKKTNEMLLKNAQNTSEQAKLIAELSSGSSIKIETLESTWQTIMNGIEETRRVQQDIAKKRQDEQVRLEAIKSDFQRHFIK